MKKSIIFLIAMFFTISAISQTSSGGSTSGGITGSLTANYLPVATAAKKLANSKIKSSNSTFLEIANPVWTSTLNLLSIKNNVSSHNVFNISDIGSSSGSSITSDYGFWGLGCDADLGYSRLLVKGSSSGTGAFTLGTKNSSNVWSFVVRDDGKVGIGTTSPTAALHIDKINDGTPLISATSSGYETFSTKLGAFKTIANAHTFDGFGGGEYTFIADANPTLFLNTRGIGQTLSIGGSIPKFATTRPAMLFETPLLGVGTFAAYTDVLAKFHVKGGENTTALLESKATNTTGYSLKAYATNTNTQSNTAVYAEASGGYMNFAIWSEQGYVVLKNLPTSPSGLLSGTVWNDAGTLKIVP